MSISFKNVWAFIHKNGLKCLVKLKHFRNASKGHFLKGMSFFEDRLSFQSKYSNHLHLKNKINRKKKYISKWKLLILFTKAVLCICKVCFF